MHIFPFMKCSYLHPVASRSFADHKPWWIYARNYPGKPDLPRTIVSQSFVGRHFQTTGIGGTDGARRRQNLSRPIALWETAPDYSRTDASGVRVVLPGGSPSLEFARLVYQEEKAMGKTLPLDQLMALNHLFFCRRTDSLTLAKAIRRDVNTARALLEK